MTDTTATAPLGTRTAILVFSVFAFAYLLSTLVRAVTATLAPTLTADLGLSPGDLGLLAGAYFFGFAATQLPMGRWLDRFGPRKVLAAFLVAAVAGCLAFSAAQGFATLTLARGLIGAGVGACLMSALTGYRRWFAPVTQLRANSWMLTAGALGMMTSTVPVQWLLPLIGWRGLFVLLAALFALAIIAVLVMVPREATKDPAPGQDVAPGPRGYAGIWTQPTFRSYAGLGFVNYGGMMALQTLWIGPWLVNIAGLSPQASAGGLFLINTGMLLTFLGWGIALPRLASRGWSAPRLVTWGVPVSLVLLAGALVLGPKATAPWWALYCMSCTVVTFAQPIVGQSFPPAQVGRGLSAFNLMIFIGVFCMQWGLGLAIDAFKALGADTQAAYQGALGVYLALSLLAWLDHLRCRRKVQDAAISGEAPVGR